MAGSDFPKMENLQPEIFISLHKFVKLVATDDNRRTLPAMFKKIVQKTTYQKMGKLKTERVSRNLKTNYNGKFLL